MIVRTHDLNPDGVVIQVEWDKFDVGSSFFIPCINTQRATEQVRRICGTFDAQVRCKARAENGRWGLRVWRTM